MIHVTQEKFFNQILNVESRLLSSNPDYILNMFANYKILHIGCVDSQYYNPKSNLHCNLAKITNNLYGFDIDIDGLKILEKDCPSSKYFYNWDDIYSQDYDVVLIPEVIEHVLDVGIFIEKIRKINTKELFISAPYFGLYNSHVKESNGLYQETVHPDHKCWYSPYTLYNIFKDVITERKASETSSVLILKSTSVALHIK